MKNLEWAARAIFFETLKAVDLPAMIRQRGRLEGGLLWFDDKAYDLSRYAEVVLIGIGKASLVMGHAVESLLGGRLTRGLLVTNRRAPLPVKSEIIVAGHPVPDAHSLRAGKRVIKILNSCSPDSLVIFLISGGGSSLFEAPISDEITLEDLQQLNQILVECGATIEEINVVRKHFSAVKGGKLRQCMKAGQAIALLVSDVNTGDFKTLASNPLFPEEEPTGRFQAITEKYLLSDKLPRLFEQFHSPLLPEGSKADEGHEPRIEAFLLAENADAVQAAERLARSLDYIVRVDRTDDEEPYQKTAARMIQAVAELKSTNPDDPVCVISGGEVSCPVRGRGFGGRNQEFALYCAVKLREAQLARSLVLSCGTDGIDGKSIAVGAVAPSSPASNEWIDASSLRHSFEQSDTTSWLNGAGGLVVTGPTGNNLRDLRIILSL